MKCMHPVLRKIKRKNDTPVYAMTPCGICENCRKNFAHMWGVRVFHESLLHDKCCFVTLTYRPENLPIGKFGYPTIDVNDFQGFIKRWREYIEPEKIRYFCGAEYSPENHLPHFHAAFFGASLWDSRVFTNHVKRDSGYSVDCRFWQKGFVHVGNLEVGSANYVAGYALKKITGSANKDYYKDRGIEPPRALMSRRPGIGYEFMTKYADTLLRLGTCAVDGNITALPRYYVNKLNYHESETYKERVKEHHENMLQQFLSRSNMTIEELQASIKQRLELEDYYYDLEKYHNQLLKGKLK